MFYNALHRKGKLEDVDESDMDSVVALHNNMNEKTWNKILEWESVIGSSTSTTKPKLLKFTGRPTDLSPKAWIKHKLLRHPMPFDRHDWTVLRDDGRTVRYVIDYYFDETRAREEEGTGMPALDDSGATPSLLVDVRPALDGPEHLFNRIVTMPYARYISHTTNFEPLPMSPSHEMRYQVKESVEVWKSIQATAAGPRSTGTSPNNLLTMKEEAKELARRLERAMSDCQDARAKLDRCDTDEKCLRASMDWSVCMGKILCPKEHAALNKALAKDAHVEDALSQMTECVLSTTSKYEAARRHLYNKKTKTTKE